MDPSRKGEIQKGKRGRGKPRGTTSPLCRTARGEKRFGPGALLAGLRPKGRRGQATRRQHAHPRWGARTPARGPATAPLLHCFTYSSLGGWLRCVAKREWSEVKRERGPKRMRLGFPRGGATSGFYPTENGARSSDLIRRRGVTGPFNGPGGRARCGVLSAQAHAAAWVAARARVPSWAGPFCRLGHSAVKN